MKIVLPPRPMSGRGARASMPARPAELPLPVLRKAASGDALEVISWLDQGGDVDAGRCLLYTSPSPRDMRRSRMPSSA